MRIQGLIPAIALTLAFPAQMLRSQPVIPSPQTTYADLADLALAAPTVISGTVARVTRLKGEQAAGVAPGHARLYVQAAVTALIRAPQGVPGQVSYLVDVPLDSRGRLPKLKKQQVLLLGQPVSGRAGEIQLVAPDAQLPWTPETEATMRAIVLASTRADAPPRITGIGNAFHVPGSLPGEGETQIFLTTADHRPVSLNVLRRPGERPRWAVALSEIVDEAAEPPARDTLLWYRLACFLPQTLPADALEGAEPDQIEIARTDYRLVIAGLGPCVRNRAVR
ncbi:MAG: hypothetical protein ABS87_10620 [Sphingomonas sp. SCN 67-18]|uniref:hypothetical protein n=1 Tax=uncultured Sphingomonas sp. TaxID=158754 RepID=UPI00086AAC24|nr:hypothetical protein [Sphingomonas sp. SCN 67-18]ODU20566.1 MAG: hypothetical protein ABS87_10620 [Sphingomonas sp. SCN 67-18]